MWIVRFGVALTRGSYSVNRFYTAYHCAQFVRALDLNGTPLHVEERS